MLTICQTKQSSITPDPAIVAGFLLPALTESRAQRGWGGVNRSNVLFVVEINRLQK
jgi:hypothetical protein